MSIELNLTAKEIYEKEFKKTRVKGYSCLLYTSPSPRDS